MLENKILLLNFYLQHSVDFLNSANIEYMDYSDLLQTLQINREKTIKLISDNDNQTRKEITETNKSEAIATSLEIIKNLSRKVDQISTEIFRLDVEILKKISRDKDYLKDKLASFNRTGKIVMKFKSSWIPNSGFKLDGSL